jgi:hypothetical protein
VAEEPAEKLEIMSFRTPFGFLSGVKPELSCEQQVPHPQTIRVRDDKRAFSRSL